MSVVEQPRIMLEITTETSEERLERLKAKSLEWINMIRQEHGLETLAEMPRGDRGQSHKCALANAAKGLGDGSMSWPCEGRSTPNPDGLSFARNGKVVNYPPPSEVTAFINEFDAGSYPDLVA